MYIRLYPIEGCMEVFLLFQVSFSVWPHGVKCSLHTNDISHVLFRWHTVNLVFFVMF